MASMLSSVLGSAARLVVKFSDADTRQTVSVRQPDGRDEEQYLFSSTDNITGMVELELQGSRKLEHTGVKVELIGMIEMLQDRSNTYEFTSLVRELEPAGGAVGEGTLGRGHCARLVDGRAQPTQLQLVLGSRRLGALRHLLCGSGHARVGLARGTSQRLELL